MALRRRHALDERSRNALAAVLANPAWEVLPLASTEGQIASLPAGSEVSVTASPTKPIEATVELAARLQAAGFHAIPHLSARMIRDRAHLDELVSRIADAGIVEIFVVGGDAETPGEFVDGLALLRALAERGHAFRHVGIPCYPDGHAFIPDDALLAALAAKAEHATYMTTQLCFDAAKIDAWLRARRADGIGLPVVLGVPGAVEPHRLVTIGARIGVRDTKRFVLKNLGLVGRLLRSGGFYRPDGLLDELAPTIGDPLLDVQGVHLYTFNQIDLTRQWWEGALARIGAEPAPTGAARTSGPAGAAVPDSRSDPAA